MRTLTLIRIALLIFILCLAGYNQSIEEAGPGIETESNELQNQVSGTSTGCQKISLLVQRQSAENKTVRFKDY